MSLGQYRYHCELYVADSPVYVKDAWMLRASSPQPSPAAPLDVPGDVHDAYDLYAIQEESAVPDITIARERGDVASRASSSGRLDLQLLLVRITSLAGENMALTRNVADKDNRIAELEEKHLSSEEKLVVMYDCASAATASPR